MKFFSKVIRFFLGYFDPINIFLIIKINNFRGDLSDILAKTASLLDSGRLWGIQHRLYAYSSR